MTGMLELLHFNPVSFGLTIIIFISVLIVLSQVAWKPILKALDERDDKIRGDLDAAEKSRIEASELLEKQKAELAGLKEEAKKIREEALGLAERQKSEILAVAKTEAESILAKARQDLQAEKEKALDEVKKLAVTVGVDLAAKLLRKEIREQEHEELVSASLGELESAYRKQVS